MWLWQNCDCVAYFSWWSCKSWWAWGCVGERWESICTLFFISLMKWRLIRNEHGKECKEGVERGKSSGARLWCPPVFIGLRKFFGLDDADIQELEQGKYRVSLVPLCLFSVCRGPPVCSLLPVWSSQKCHSRAFWWDRGVGKASCDHGVEGASICGRIRNASLPVFYLCPSSKRDSNQ